MSNSQPDTPVSSNERSFYDRVAERAIVETRYPLALFAVCSLCGKRTDSLSLHRMDPAPRHNKGCPLEIRPVETKARIPPANPQLDAHVNAVAEFMQELAPYLGLDDGLVSTRDFIDAARRIREWCHDHQSLPKLEYNEHCGCCTRNKITVEVFARPAVEPSPRKCPRCERMVTVGCNYCACPFPNAVEVAHSPEKASAARAPEVCGCPYGQCRCDDGSGVNGNGDAA